MSQAISYLSLRSLVSEQFWPHELFPLDQDGDNILDEFALIDSQFNAFANGYSMSIQTKWMRKLEVPLPLLPGCALVMGDQTTDDQEDMIEIDFFVGQEAKSNIEIQLGEEDEASFTSSPWQIKLHIRCPAFYLQVNRDLLTPVEIKEEDGQLEVNEKDGHVNIPLVNVQLTVQYDGEEWSIALDKEDSEQGIDLPTCKIGESGVIVEAENISFRLSGEGPKPEQANDDWKGLYFERARIYLPEIMDGSIAAEGLGLGSGGVYGRVEYTGDLAAEVLGMQGTISSIALEFAKSIPVEADIGAQVVLPFFDEPVQVAIGLGLDGDAYVRLQDTDEEGLFVLEKQDVLQAKLESLSFAREDGRWMTRLSGTIRPTMGEINWPEFVMQEMLIDSEGNVRIDGGWIDVPEKVSFDYHGFQAEVTKVGFGADEDQQGRYRWIGLSGSIKLADELEISGSVKGMKLKWRENGASEVELTGVGVAFEIPEVLSFEGEVSFLDGDGIKGFKGDIELDLPTLGVQMEAAIIIGRNEHEAFPFYYIFVDTELPAGIVLGPTGLSLYGLSGLFASNMEPDKTQEEEWYDWYKSGEQGVTSTDKWKDNKGSLALGAGMTVGTATDNGYMVSAKTLLAILLPGPIIMIQGKADFLAERTSHSSGEEGNFDALAVLDHRAGEFLMNVEANYQFDQAGRVLDIHAGAEAFFDYNQLNNWHFYLGQEPREHRIRAKILSLFTAEAYFMLEPGKLAFGYWQGFDERWKFGPVRVEASAFSEAHVAASVNPQQFWGKAGLHGDLDLRVYGFHFGFYLDAGIEVNTPSPFSILARLAFGISLPWPLPDFDVKIKLKWQKDAPIEVSPPLKEVAASHALTQLPIALTKSNVEVPVVPMDGPIVVTFEKEMLDDTGVTPNALPPEPLWQQIEYSAQQDEDKAKYEFQYTLQEIKLQHQRSGSWQDISQPIHGVWLPQEGDNEAPAQTKLLLLADNFMETYRYATRSAKDAFFEKYPDYPCVPEYVKHIECMTFEGLPKGASEYQLTHENTLFETLTTSGQWVGKNDRLCLQSEVGDHDLPVGMITLPETVDSIGLSFHLVFCAMTITGYDCHMNILLREQFHPDWDTLILDVEDEWLTDRGKGKGCSEIQYIHIGMHPIKPNPKYDELPEPTVEWTKICYITCSEVEKERTYDWHREQQLQQLDQWFGEGTVLDPYTDYRVKIITDIAQKKNDELQDNSDVDTSYYYFRTEGPPGYAPHLPQQSIEYPQKNTVIDNVHPLQTLNRYVRQTIPSHGQKPFYRAYDLSVFWKEDTHVPLMYRLAKQDLGIYVYDSNGETIADSTGRLLAWERSWSQMTEGEWGPEREQLKQQLKNSSCIDVREHDAPEISALDNGPKGRYLLANEHYEARVQPISYVEDFSRFDSQNWKIFNEGNTDRPQDESKQWVIGTREVNGSEVFYLKQTSNIYSRIDGAFDLPAARGTYLLYENEEWSDQRITVRLSSEDDDAIGIMFGYQDKDHYYRFSMDSERKIRRLLKMEQGRPTILAEDKFQYRQQQTYQMTVEMVAGTIQVYMDGERIFTVQDSTFDEGKVALYCWGNDLAYFYEVMIEDLRSDALTLYEYDFVTSAYVNFFHHLHSFNHRVWKKALPGSGDVRKQSFAEVWPSPLLRPQQVSIDVVMTGSKPTGFLLQSPEPMDWERIKWQAEQSDEAYPIGGFEQVKLAEWDENSASGLTLLVLKNTSLQGWKVEYKDASLKADWKLYSTFKQDEEHPKVYTEGETIFLQNKLSKLPILRKNRRDPRRPSFKMKKFRLVDAAGRVVHERVFVASSPSVYKPLSMRCLPSEDGTAALFLCDAGSSIQKNRTYRLALEFLREKDGLPTLKQWGSQDPERVTLDFVW